MQGASAALVAERFDDDARRIDLTGVKP